MTIKIDQALIQHFISGSFGLPIAHENLPYSPVAGTAYAEILVIQNDITAADLSHTNETDGIFRVILRYPVDSGSIAVKQKADAIFSYFKIGSEIAYAGQEIVITRHARANGYSEQGWYKIVITISYKAFLAR
ncbi:phage tail terminator-like protein [Nitrosomonas communis]|uniref:phage tail terminator-like protein n=1 Tax=Nitrosomonas communis TaxID=44574 RepID=UPI0026EB0783|nr:phage tail terminator-like protein [Nitrosomonas communis]MCO6427057.1 hypothetical protein [Nitrosomonas communis]